MVISHCSVVGRHVNGVGVTFLCTTYVFLILGRNGLYTRRIELIIINTSTRAMTTPTDTKIAVLFIESLHVPLRNALPAVFCNGIALRSVVLRRLQLKWTKKKWS